MKCVLEGITPQKCFIYLDYGLVVGSTFEEHLENLKDVLSALQTAGLTKQMKPSKCVFEHTSVKYLGFVISNDGLMPNAEKAKVISDYLRPKNVQDLYRFVGLVSYYRWFVSGFSDMISLLNYIVTENTNFVWNNECESAFCTLKAELIAAPVYAFPTTHGQFVLYTEASDVGIGAVLAQQCLKGFSSSEKNWAVTEKEAFAVVWALQYLHAYVYSEPIIVYSDHQALNWLHNMKQLSGKLAPWILN